MDQGDPVVAVSGRDPQSVFTPIVQKMKADGSNWSLNVASANQALLLRNEADAPGHRPVESVLWECVVVLRQRARHRQRGRVRGRGPAPRASCPFEEASVNKTVANFVKYMKQVGGTPDQFAAYSYAAVLAFADAVNAVVKADGVNGLTRANLITAIKGLTDFDAGGMLGKRSFKDGKITSLLPDGRSSRTASGCASTRRRRARSTARRRTRSRSRANLIQQAESRGSPGVRWSRRSDSPAMAD